MFELKKNKKQQKQAPLKLKSPGQLKSNHKARYLPPGAILDSKMCSTCLLI